ncbi:hypothetical protein AB1285_18395 [Microbacterium sp. NRRL B-14842]|uniref:hypothetical protein n=1 Tax=Microbacterium sp. NRRL B-14842 TaxID=3162881 RepID=UPI003D2A2D74
MSTRGEGQHPEDPGARDADEHVPTHTRRGFLIAAGTGVAVTGVGIWLSANSGEEADDTGRRPDNPRGLPEYEPVYDRAVTGLEVPLGSRTVPIPRSAPTAASRGVIAGP